MIPFHSISLEDYDWVQPLLRTEGSRSADFSFANMYIWDQTDRQEVAEVQGCLVVRLNYAENPSYLFPVGGGDVKAAILALREDASALGIRLRLRGLLPIHISFLETEFPNEYTVCPDRFAFDYLYDAQRLSTFSGKKLQPKRNHINRFLECYPNWSFEPITEATLSECENYQAAWMALHSCNDPKGFAAEQLALERSFKYWDILHLEGGILRAESRIIGYTVGEVLNSDTFGVHFEKADSEIQGAYPMVCREFARQILHDHPGIQFINREDDMGHENLQRAKLSYAPALLIEKHTATWKEL